MASHRIDLTEAITPHLRSLITYYEGIGHKSVEPLLLEKGCWFEGRRHSDDYPTAKAFRKKNRPKAKQCYNNAQLYCCEDSSARYFEGYALIRPSLSPAEHAWVVMPDGGVVDFTFEALERQSKFEEIPCNTAGTVYLGLEIPQPFVRRKLLEDEETQPLIDLFYANPQ